MTELSGSQMKREKDTNQENAIEIEQGSFQWGTDDQFDLENIDLRVKKKSLVAIVGAVGSGKSSLLSAILGKT